MPEENELEPSNIFSNEPVKPFKAEPEIQPDNEPDTRWELISGFIPGTILNILAVLFLLSNYGILKGDWWQYFLVLLLVVFLIEYWVVYISPANFKSRLKMGILGIFLIAIGALFIFNPNVWWPLALLIVGHILIIIFFIQRLGNRKIRDSKTDKTKIDAGRATVTPFEPGKEKLAVYLDGWLKDEVIPNFSPRAANSYRMIVENHINPALGNFELRQIKPIDIQKYYYEKITAGLSGRTVRNHHIVLNNALENAVILGLIASNPCDITKPPKNYASEN